MNVSSLVRLYSSIISPPRAPKHTQFQRNKAAISFIFCHNFELDNEQQQQQQQYGMRNTSFPLYFLASSAMISCRVDPIYDFIFSLLSIAFGTLYGPHCSDGKSSSSTTSTVCRPFAYSWLLKILFFHFVSFLSRRFFLSSAGFCRQCLFAGRAAKNSSHIFCEKRDQRQRPSHRSFLCFPP